MERSVDTILGDLEERVREKQPMAPGWWVDAAQYLNVLIGNENDTLAEMKQNIAKMKVKLLEEHDKVNKVELLIEAKDEYRDMKKQEARIGQIQEFIRIAKLQGRLASEEMRHQ